MSLVCFTLGLSCLGPFGLLGLGWLFPSPFEGSFLLLSPQIFSHALSFLYSSGTEDLNAGAFNIVPEVSEVILISSAFFLTASFISTILSSTSLILSSASVILLFVPFRVFLISVNTLFFIDYFFLISSRSLLNILSSQSMSLVYLSVSPFCYQGIESSLLLLFSILFQVDSLFTPLCLACCFFFFFFF